MLTSGSSASVLYRYKTLLAEIGLAISRRISRYEDKVSGQLVSVGKTRKSWFWLGIVRICGDLYLMGTYAVCAFSSPLNTYAFRPQTDLGLQASRKAFIYFWLLATI